MAKRQPDIYKLARRQRGILWVILAVVAVYAFQLLFADTLFGMGSEFEVVTLVFLTIVQFALTICVTVFVALVLHAMGVHPIGIVLCALASLAPCANLLLLVVMNSAATRRLRQAGLHVRFMGVDPEEVERVLNPHLCNTCGYDLTGNVSGTCPECGTPVPPMARPLDQSAPLADP